MSYAARKKRSGLETYQLKTLIDWYIRTFKTISNWPRTKQTTLEFLGRHSQSCSEHLSRIGRLIERLGACVLLPEASLANGTWADIVSMK
jgi:hypothetical protein